MGLELQDVVTHHNALAPVDQCSKYALQSATGARNRDCVAAPVPVSESPKLVEPPKVAAVLPLLSRWNSRAVSARLKTWSCPCACAGVLDSEVAALLESSPAAIHPR